MVSIQISSNKKTMENKSLKLIVTKEWFDMIVSGYKREEYRELKQYWLPRLVKETSDDGNHIYREFDTVVFRNGYSKNAPECTVECQGIAVDYGREEWGAKPDKHYFVIYLGDVLKTKNIKL